MGWNDRQEEAVGGLPLVVELVAAYAAGDRLRLEEVEAELRRDGVSAAAGWLRGMLRITACMCHI